MGVTPAYLAAVATFYDMLETEPVGRHSIYVCTNISCSLRGADALHAAVCEAAGDDPEFNVRSFECLGACDIAPMASVDGVFVGPLALEDVPQLLEDMRAGRAGAARQAALHAQGRRPERQLAASSLRTRSRPALDRASGGAAPEALRLPRDPLGGAAMTEALLFKDIDEPGLATLEVYAKRGGYESLRKALGDDPRGAARPARSLRPARTRRGRLCDGQEGLVPAQRLDRQVPRLQRGRVRARHVQGPGTDAEVPAHADRGNRDRLLRGRRQPLVHLHQRRVRPPGRRARRGAWPKRARPATSARTSSDRATRSRWWCTAAPAPTSAARRPACSTRWKASAATRA